MLTDSLLNTAELTNARFFSGASAAEDEFVSLFNGRDLAGWVNANCAPETWSVTNGVIHCTGIPTGALRTARQYENFILELEWRHLTPGGNSGVFIWATPIAAPGVPFLRGIEVQVLDHGFNVPGKNEWYTTHGDVFPIHGATMKPFGRHNGMRSFPSEERSKGSPEWNQYRIECTNGVLRLSVNGKEVSGGEECNYRKGFIGLESEGAPIEFRNIRIRELASSKVSEEFRAPADLHWRPLFTGVDFRGWVTNANTGSRWVVEGQRIRLKEGMPTTGALWTATEFGDSEFILDCKLRKGGTAKSVEILIGNRLVETLRLKIPASETEFRRFFVRLQGREVIVQLNGAEQSRSTFPAAGQAKLALGLGDVGGGIEVMNVYQRDL